MLRLAGVVGTCCMLLTTLIVVREVPWRSEARRGGFDSKPRAVFLLSFFLGEGGQGRFGLGGGRGGQRFRQNGVSMICEVS